MDPWKKASELLKMCSNECHCLSPQPRRMSYTMPSSPSAVVIHVKVLHNWIEFQIRQSHPDRNSLREKKAELEQTEYQCFEDPLTPTLIPIPLPPPKKKMNTFFDQDNWQQSEEANLASWLWIKFDWEGEFLHSPANSPILRVAWSCAELKSLVT